MEQKRRGRPPKLDGARRQRMDLRLTEEELARLEREARRRGWSKTQTLLKGLERLEGEE